MIMSEDRYAVIWEAATGQGWELYDTEDEAVAALSDFAGKYPWNIYILARIVGGKPASAPQPPDSARGIVTIPGEPESVATADICVQGGTITAITITSGYSRKP
jgi:hypothetical protein